MIFITAMLVQKDSLRQVAQLCKAKGKRVVLGGPYVTTTVEDCRMLITSFWAKLKLRVLYVDDDEDSRIHNLLADALRLAAMG